MTELRWDCEDDADLTEVAYSGDRRVGFIVRTVARPQRWHYAIDAVQIPYGRKGAGHVANRSAAKKALASGWAKWCARAEPEADI